MRVGVGRVERTLRVGINRREPALARGQHAVHPHLKLVEVELQRLGFVRGHVVGDADVRDGNAGELAGEADGVEPSPVVTRDGDNRRLIAGELPHREAVPECSLSAHIRPPSQLRRPATRARRRFRFWRAPARVAGSGAAAPSSSCCYRATPCRPRCRPAACSRR